MSFVGQLLLPYSDVLGKIAGTLTSLQILSFIFLLNDIRKKKTTSGSPAGPFIGGIVLSVLCLKFGAILRDDAMIKTNLFCFTMSVIYFMIFHWYTPNNEKFMLWKQTGFAAIFTIACLIYAEYENYELIEHRFGMILTIFLILLVSAPLFDLKTIIRTKNCDNLPFPLIFSGAIISTSWLLYGLSISNTVLIIQNGILLLLNLFQLSLFVIYPKKTTSYKKTN